MNFDVCHSGSVLLAIGLIMMLGAFIPFFRAIYLERTTGLTSSAYLKLGLVGWILNTIWISMMVLGAFSFDESKCSLSENAGTFLLLICPGILSLIATSVLLVAVWVERLRRTTKEELNNTPLNNSILDKI